MDLFEARADGLPETIRHRCRHVFTENRRAQESARVRKEGDLEALGALMDAGHDSLRVDYEVSIPELDHLMQTARATEGPYGARMTGPGFGGCVVWPTFDAALNPLQRCLTDRYAERFERQPTLYLVEESLEVKTLRMEER